MRIFYQIAFLIMVNSLSASTPGSSNGDGVMNSASFDEVFQAFHGFIYEPLPVSSSMGGDQLDPSYDERNGIICSRSLPPFSEIILKRLYGSDYHDLQSFPVGYQMHIPPHARAVVIDVYGGDTFDSPYVQKNLTGGIRPFFSQTVERALWEQGIGTISLTTPDWLYLNTSQSNMHKWISDYISKSIVHFCRTLRFRPKAFDSRLNFLVNPRIKFFLHGISYGGTTIHRAGANCPYVNGLIATNGALMKLWRTDLRRVLRDGGNSFALEESSYNPPASLGNPMLLIQNADDNNVTLARTLETMVELKKRGENHLVNLTVIPHGQIESATCLHGHLVPTNPDDFARYMHAMVTFIFKRLKPLALNQYVEIKNNFKAVRVWGRASPEVKYAYHAYPLYLAHRDQQMSDEAYMSQLRYLHLLTRASDKELDGAYQSLNTDEQRIFVRNYLEKDFTRLMHFAQDVKGFPKRSTRFEEYSESEKNRFIDAVLSSYGLVQRGIHGSEFLLSLAVANLDLTPFVIKLPRIFAEDFTTVHNAFMDQVGELKKAARQAIISAARRVRHQQTFQKALTSYKKYMATYFMDMQADRRNVYNKYAALFEMPSFDSLNSFEKSIFYVPYLKKRQLEYMEKLKWALDFEQLYSYERGILAEDLPFSQLKKVVFNPANSVMTRVQCLAAVLSGGLVSLPESLQNAGKPGAAPLHESYIWLQMSLAAHAHHWR